MSHTTACPNQPASTANSPPSSPCGHGSLPAESSGVITHVTDDRTSSGRGTQPRECRTSSRRSRRCSADSNSPRRHPAPKVPTTVVDEAAETLPPEDTLPDSVVAGAAETLPPEDTVPPPPMGADSAAQLDATRGRRRLDSSRRLRQVPTPTVSERHGSGGVGRWGGSLGPDAKWDQHPTGPTRADPTPSRNNVEIPP